jgi:transmembrane sensor
MSEITALLVDYVSDALSPEDRAAVEARLRTDAEFRATAAPLLAVWRMTPPEPTDSRAAMVALRAAIAADEVRHRRRPARTLAVAAAALVACLVLGVYAPGLYRIVAPVVQAHHVMTYATAPGERLSVRLPDGSSATLGPDSRLGYRATFFEPVPQITASGAVGFHVVHQIAVRAGPARVQATRARFSLQAYPGQADARVTVTEGSAQVVAGIAWTVAAGVTAYVTDTAVVLRRTSDERTVP